MLNFRQNIGNIGNIGYTGTIGLIIESFLSIWVKLAAENW